MRHKPILNITLALVVGLSLIFFVSPFMAMPPVPSSTYRIQSTQTIQEIIFAKPRYASPSYTLWGLGGGLFPSGGSPTRLSYYYAFTIPDIGGYQIGPGYLNVAVNAVILVFLIVLLFTFKKHSLEITPEK